MNMAEPCPNVAGGKQTRNVSRLTDENKRESALDGWGPEQVVTEYVD